DVAAGGTLAIGGSSNNLGGYKVTASGNITNAGTIKLENLGNLGFAGNPNALESTNGIISNTGTILVLPGDGGSRTIRGNLENWGIVSTTTTLSFPVTGQSIVNYGDFQVSSNITLTLLAYSQFFTQAAGTLSF